MTESARNESDVRRPPLADRHAANGARTTAFGGWEMPVRFDSIAAEHAAVRERAGIFDVSHLSRIAIQGPDARAVTDALTTNDVDDLSVGDAQYACICRDDGIILDDTVVYRREGEHLVMPNAGLDERMAARWRDHAAANGHEITVVNRTADEAMFAVQGPDAVAAVDAVADGPVTELDRWTGTDVEVAGTGAFVARTGYTGEDGVEIVVDAADAAGVWDAILNGPEDVTRCGLGARDTLRLEAGLLLSGQDFHPADEPRTPAEARLDFAVGDGPFVGRDAIDEPAEVIVGLELDERAVPRTGYPIVRDGEAVGHVTSGTISPSFDVPIALGYVPVEIAEPGTTVDVEVRGDPVPATIVERTFLDRHSHQPDG
jgi:aminomethyltransferase